MQFVSTMNSTDGSNDEKLSDSSHMVTSQFIEFDIKLSLKDWHCIKPFKKVYKDNRAYDIFPQGWTHIINDKIWEVIKLPCAFSFKKHHFYKSEGYPYFDFYGHCSECHAPFSGYCENSPSELNEFLILHVKTIDSSSVPHKKKKIFVWKSP